MVSHISRVQSIRPEGEVDTIYAGYDPIPIGIRTLPIGFGIIGGAAIALWLIPVIKGRTRILMIINTCIMTAGTGASK